MLLLLGTGAQGSHLDFPTTGGAFLNTSLGHCHFTKAVTAGPGGGGGGDGGGWCELTGHPLGSAVQAHSVTSDVACFKTQAALTFTSGT